MGLSCSRRDLHRAGVKSSPVLSEDGQGSLRTGYTNATWKVQEKMRFSLSAMFSLWGTFIDRKLRTRGAGLAGRRGIHLTAVPVVPHTWLQSVQ